MSLTCSMDFYTLNQLPSYRKEFIDTRLSKFLIDFSINDWPLDCVKLIKQIRDDKKVPLQIGFARNIQGNFDAVSRYIKEDNIYQIIFNRDKINYPFIESQDRRFNFTIAHELGHILLDHLFIPDNLKSHSEKHIENLEADEFAGKLLMPKKLLLNCNFVSFPKVAEYFNVSNSALWMRLNNLQKLDLISTRKSCVCNICGNTEMHYVAKYCHICGNMLENNLDGIERNIYLDGIQLDSNNLVYNCPHCGEEPDYFFNEKCSTCGTMLYNYCQNSLYLHKGNCQHKNPGNARFCEMCGGETYFYTNGFLKPWKEARSIMLSTAVTEGSMEYFY